MKEQQNQEAIFAKQIDTLAARAEKSGEITVSHFLTPSELATAKEQMTRAGAGELTMTLGGFPNAERRKMAFFPSYVGAMGLPITEAAAAIGQEDRLRESIVILKIRASGFEKELTHRSLLGSILGLGLERDAIGDIAVLDGTNALVAIDGKIAAFVEENLCRVGRDTVSVFRMAPDEEAPPIVFQTEEICDTVASARIDCVVAALVNISREKAREMIASSLVEVNYREVTENDKIVCADSVITIHGKGKFTVTEIGEQTRKGRLRLKALKRI